MWLVYGYVGFVVTWGVCLGFKAGGLLGFGYLVVVTWVCLGYLVL